MINKGKYNHLLAYRGTQDHVLKAYQDFTTDIYLLNK